MNFNEILNLNFKKNLKQQMNEFKYKHSQFDQIKVYH